MASPSAPDGCGAPLQANALGYRTRRVAEISAPVGAGSGVARTRLLVCDADFTQDLADKHRKACLYRRNSGSPFQCKDCNVPVSVKKEHLLHYRTYPHMYRLKCQDCQGWTADASVQTNLPVRDKKQNKGKGSGQQEGQARKEGPSSRSMAW